MILFVFCLTAIVSQSQENRWGFAIKLNTAPDITQFYDLNYSKNYFENRSFSVGVTGRYKLTEDLYLRLNYDFSDTRIYCSGTTADFYNNAVSTIGAYDWDISGGLEVCKTFDKFQFYTGAELKFKQYTRAYYDMILSTTSDTLRLQGERTEHYPGGWAAGASAFAGYRYNIYKRFSLGMEFTLFCGYLNIEGYSDYSEATNYYNLSTGKYLSTLSSSAYYAYKYSRTAFSDFQFSASLNYWF